MDTFKHFKEKFKKILKGKLEGYRNSERIRQAGVWLEGSTQRIRLFFQDHEWRDFIFEPFKGVFRPPAKTMDADVYAVITQVAVINAVLAGLPGRMGVGVYVSMALEGWMAYVIARHVGLNIEKTSDIWKYFGLLAAALGIILYGFRAFIGFGFSLFSIIPGINPLILAEILVTDLIGVLFLAGFGEARKTGSFTIPKRLIFSIFSQAWAIFKYQFGILRAVLSIENLKLVGRRLKAFLSGDIPVDMKTFNGETFATVAMAYLLAGRYDTLDGPLGETFLNAIRLRWSAQFDENATVEDIAGRFREYDEEQLAGVMNTIKGKMFEVMVADQENLDSDSWQAYMHTDESFPGTDIVFTDIRTGEQVDVSLKAVAESNTSMIEHALVRYPDKPIMTTEEAAALFDDDSRVFGSGIHYEDLRDITEEKFDQLIHSMEVNAEGVVIAGVAVGKFTVLWPFFMAYYRKKITYEQFETVMGKVLGEAGLSLASRMSYALLLGPVFAWYLLARGVKGMVELAESAGAKRYIEFIPKKSAT